MFKSIEENVEAEIVEKKSKFIAHIYYVESVEEAENLIKQANKKYFDARHNCYAFCINDEGNNPINRFSDDGEPSGTAGAPILNILTSQNLSNVLVIITRYFGGILLGTGGLVKAYSLAVQEALNKAKIITKDLGKEVQIIVNYADFEKLKYYLNQNNIKMIDVKYEENICVNIEITDQKLEKMLQEKESFNFKIIDYSIIKQKFIKI